MQKRIQFLCAILWFLPFFAHAQLLKFDNFPYGDGSLTTSSQSRWNAHSAGGSNPVTSAAAKLNFAGYGGDNTGTVVLTGGSGSREDVNRVFEPINSGNLYVSFLVNVASANATNDYFLHFIMPNNGATSTTFAGRVHVKDEGGFLKLGISKGATDPAFAAEVFNYNTTYLCVMKYVFKPDITDDEVYFYVFKQGTALTATEATPAVGPLLGAVSTASNDPASLGFIALRQGANAYNLKLGGLRIGRDWKTTVTGTLPTAKEVNDLPAAFELSNAYPNPFNPSTSFEVHLPEMSFAKVRVFNILGQEVASLYEGYLAAGTKKFLFDATGLTSGVYFYRVETARFQQTKTMILQK